MPTYCIWDPGWKVGGTLRRFPVASKVSCVRWRVVAELRDGSQVRPTSGRARQSLQMQAVRDAVTCVTCCRVLSVSVEALAVVLGLPVAQTWAMGIIQGTGDIRTAIGQTIAV